DVVQRVQEEDGTYYNVDREGRLRKIPDSGPSATSAAMMVRVKHEGRVVGVVQLMRDRGAYASDDLELFEGLVGQLSAGAERPPAKGATKARRRGSSCPGAGRGARTGGACWRSSATASSSSTARATLPSGTRRLRR